MRSSSGCASRCARWCLLASISGRAQLGPMDGSAQGEFGPLVQVHAWELFMRREPLERLQVPFPNL